MARFQPSARLPTLFMVFLLVFFFSGCLSAPGRHVSHAHSRLDKRIIQVSSAPKNISEDLTRAVDRVDGRHILQGLPGDVRLDGFQGLNSDDTPPDSSTGLSPESFSGSSSDDEPAWERCFAKGQALLCASSPGAALPPQSPYEDRGLLDRWGWTVSTALLNPPRPQPPRGAAETLGSLGLSTGLDANIYVSLLHNRPWQDAQGASQPPTGGYYREYFNPTQGAFVLSDNVSPSQAADGGPSPELGRLSDLVWLEWKHQCETHGADPGSLRYIIRDNIQTG